MKKYIDVIINDGVIFLLMGIVAVIKDMVGSEQKINWPKLWSKLFTKIAVGAGFYSFLLSYKPWYGEYPQKVGIIMIAVYVGDKIIDVIADKLFAFFKKFDLKTLIKKLFEL